MLQCNFCSHVAPAAALCLVLRRPGLPACSFLKAACLPPVYLRRDFAFYGNKLFQGTFIKVG